MKSYDLEFDLGELGYHECAVTFQTAEDGLCEVLKVEVYADDWMVDVTPLVGSEAAEQLAELVADITESEEPEYEPEDYL